MRGRRRLADEALRGAADVGGHAGADEANLANDDVGPRPEFDLAERKRFRLGLGQRVAGAVGGEGRAAVERSSEEHTSVPPLLMRISYDDPCLNTKTIIQQHQT